MQATALEMTSSALNYIVDLDSLNYALLGSAQGLKFTRAANYNLLPLHISKIFVLCIKIHFEEVLLGSSYLSYVIIIFKI